MQIKVFDVQFGNFRELNPLNYNDDLTFGLVYFNKESLSVFKQYFLICGYCLIDKKDGGFYPIDIQTNLVAIFEGTFNCFDSELQNKLEPFCLDKKPSPIMSKFFFEWQLECSSDCFIENGSFIRLCNNCLGSQGALETLLKADCHLVEPDNREELSSIIKKLVKIFSLSIYDKDYNETFKYVIDGLMRNFYIRFSELEIKQYFYQICTLCNESLGDK